MMRYILTRGNRQWIFYSAAIAIAVVTILLLGMRESRPSKLLDRKIAAIARESPGATLPYRTADPFPSVSSFIDVVFIRSARMMLMEPILITVSAMSAISWGIVYLFSESSLSAFKGIGVPEIRASLPMLAMIIGVFFDVFPHIWDVRMLRMRKKLGIPVEPEDKIRGFAYGTPALAVGLWWFYGTTPPSLDSVHWIVPTLPLVLIGFGVNEIAYTLSGYLTDTYTVYAASAFSGLAFVRAVVSGIMPIIGYVVFEEIESYVPGFVVAAIATLFCAVPFAFYRTGKTLRERSPFAQYSLEMNKETQLDDA